MTTVNHECYVSPEVAKLLKEAGFDWEYTHYYSVNTLHEPNNGFIHIYKQYGALFYNHNRTKMPVYSAPTLDVAQRWLRVVKGIHLYVRPILDEHKYVVTVVVDDLTWGQVNDNNGTAKRFNTYEEAQEAGIKKALELILEKGK